MFKIYKSKTVEQSSKGNSKAGIRWDEVSLELSCIYRFGGCNLLERILGRWNLLERTLGGCNISWTNYISLPIVKSKE